MQESSSSIASSLKVSPFAFSPLGIVPFAFSSMAIGVAVVDVLLMLTVAAVVAMAALNGFDVGVPTLLYTSAAAAA